MFLKIKVNFHYRLTKIAGDKKYEDNPLIANFDLETEGTINKISDLNSIIIYSIIALAVIVASITLIYKKRLKLTINKKSKIWNFAQIEYKYTFKKMDYRK